MGVQVKRLLWAMAGFFLGALTLYLGGLFTLIVLKTAAVEGLFASLIGGPIIFAVILRKAASVHSETAKRRGYTIAYAFGAGFVVAAIFWLYMVDTALVPISRMG